MIQNKNDYKRYKKIDLEKNKFKNTFFSYLTNDIWRFLRILRSYEYVLNTKKSVLWAPLKFYLKYRFKKISKKLGYSIPPNVFAEGLMLPHYGNIVVNRKVKIGKNCKIHVGVNIGASFHNSDETPTLGDNCYIAPGAKIYGNVKLRNNIMIGANAVVNKSCEHNGAVLVGIPAKIIRIESE